MEKSWGYCKRRTKTQRQEAQLQNFRTSEKFWLQGTHKSRAHPKVPIPTLKPSSTKEPTSSGARHTMLILQQNRNKTLNIKKTGCPKPYQTHRHPQNSLLGTSLNSREKRSSSTHQNTDASSHNQETLTSHYSNPTHREWTPQLRETMNFQPAERAPQT